MNMATNIYVTSDQESNLTVKMFMLCQHIIVQLYHQVNTESIPLVYKYDIRFHCEIDSVSYL